jgi:histidinol-phosphate aminotransferase
MLPFIRSDFSQVTAYIPHSSSDTALVVSPPDRLDTNESPYDLPVELKQKLAWTYQELIETNRYPDGGYENLKGAIAEYVSESGTLFDSSHISVGNGSDELLRSVLIASCLNGEGSVLIANPTFSMYGILAKTLGIPVVTVGRNEANFEMDLEAAQSAIEKTHKPPIRVIFVVHPNSPTSNPLTAAEIAWLRSLPENILVVIDEAYFEFSQNTLVGELPQRPNWIVTRTFSKAFRLAALRVGYGIAHPELIAVLEKIRFPYNLPTFSQAGAILALQHRQTLLKLIPEILSERAKMIQALSSHPALSISDSATNFLYLQMQSPTASLTTITQQLKWQGTLIRCLSHGLRITVGTPEENTRTVDRLNQILSEL